MTGNNPTQRTDTETVYFVYIVECNDGSLYTGMTTDVARRFEEHKKRRGGHYTSSKQAVRVVYVEQCENRSAALKREAHIKSWTRQKKLDLIAHSATKLPEN